MMRCVPAGLLTQGLDSARHTRSASRGRAVRMRRRSDEDRGGRGPNHRGSCGCPPGHGPNAERASDPAEQRPYAEG
jgi:hypothetical protein